MLQKLKGEKGHPEYIKKQKIYQFAMAIFYVIVAALIFLIGYYITKTRANVFTVLAILMVLPFAKRVIACIVMVPHSSVKEQEYKGFSGRLPDEADLLADYVFTSSEHIMSFRYAVVINQSILGILDKEKQDTEYIKTYLSKEFPSYRIKIFESEEKFFKYFKNVNPEKKEDKREKTLEKLKILGV